jgi:hypothetical protein
MVLKCAYISLQMLIVNTSQNNINRAKIIAQRLTIPVQCLCTSDASQKWQVA